MLLTINSGSSSLKFAAFNFDLKLKLKGIIQEIGSSNSSYKFKMENQKIESGKKDFKEHRQALPFIQKILSQYNLEKIEGVGHRVVHGGKYFSKEVIIDQKVEEQIEKLSELAPLHNPANLMGIKVAKEAFKDAIQVAVFDTSFHSTIPEVARTIPLPETIRGENIRRYGFHGISYEYIAEYFQNLLTITREKNNLIVCHLGNGASICCINKGRSIETSMGMTPLEGLVMGTRCGNIDPSVVLELCRKFGINKTHHILNSESGLLGLSGISNNMKTLIEAKKNQQKTAKLAINVFCYRIAETISKFMFLVKSPTLIFTGGIGENCPSIRQQIIENLPILGYKINLEKNLENQEDQNIGTPDRPIYIIATDEEKQIAIKTKQLSSTSPN